MGHAPAPGASLQGEDPDCVGIAAARYGGVQNAIDRPEDQRVIDNAAMQRRKRLRACVAANGGHFEHQFCCECFAAFAVNAEFYCRINRCSALK